MHVCRTIACDAGWCGRKGSRQLGADDFSHASRQQLRTRGLPILGLAGITFRSSNLDKARGYYQGVLGFQEAFSLKDASGATASIFFKVNDDQYVEVIPGLKPGELRRIARVMIQSSDLQKLHRSTRSAARIPRRSARVPTAIRCSASRRRAITTSISFSTSRDPSRRWRAASSSVRTESRPTSGTLA